MTEQNARYTEPQQPSGVPHGRPAPRRPYRPDTPPRRLVRSREDRWLAGVCGGAGEYAGIDPTVVRLLAVVGGVVSGGTLLVAYLVAWVVMPAA